MFHVEQTERELRVGALGLGLALADRQLRQLVTHLELLLLWNAKLNLAGGAERSWPSRHTLDSLAPARWLEESAIDLGSGAGFPGIPLAIAAPQTSFVLVEPRLKRAAFLRQVVAALALPNVQVLRARAETLDLQAPLVLGRAVAALEEWERMAAERCAPGGRFVVFAQGPDVSLMRSTCVERSCYVLPDEPERCVLLCVPRGTGAER